MSEWFNANGQTEENQTVPTAQPTASGDTPPVQTEPQAAEWQQPAQPVPPTEPTEPTATVPPVESPTPQKPTYETGWYRSGPQTNAEQNGGAAPTPPPYTAPPAPQPPRKKRQGVAVVVLAVVGVLAVIAMLVMLVFTIFGATDDVYLSTDEQDMQQEVIDNDAPTVNITDWADDDGGLSASEIINKNMDSTVVINVYQMQVPTGLYQYGFGSETLAKVSEATGIVMTKDGYIITNWHVVIDEKTGEPFDRIDVTTSEDKTYEDARVIGADESTDLAVIKVDADDLEVAEFGDSSKLVMGARVLTLGNAGGLQWSASQGIISGLARDVYDDTGYSIKCLQTDAAINPGNSGGPLLNNSGQVVGINSAKIAAEGYEGLGFSIPINEAKKIIDDLIKYGYARGRVELGITGYSISNNGYYGFVIRSIETGSVLEGTKARVGDLITAVDGVKIRDGYSALRTEMAKHNAGDTVTLSLLRLDSRTGQETTFTVSCTLKESKPKSKTKE